MCASNIWKSVLGPILFLFYINDLHEQVSQCHLFADDSIFYREIKKPEDSKTLQDYLNALEAWEMEYHPDKYVILRIW